MVADAWRMKRFSAPLGTVSILITVPYHSSAPSSFSPPHPKTHSTLPSQDKMNQGEDSTSTQTSAGGGTAVSTCASCSATSPCPSCQQAQSVVDSIGKTNAAAWASLALSAAASC